MSGFTHGDVIHNDSGILYVFNGHREPRALRDPTAIQMPDAAEEVMDRPLQGTVFNWPHFGD